MIEFRRAGIEDALTIVTTRRKVWDATYRGIYPDEAIDAFDYEWHLKKERARLGNSVFQCDLVLDDGACVGYYSYGTVSAGRWADFPFRFHSLYLLPDYQGMGLGKKIFARVRECCLAMGYEKMYLDCHPDNHKALGFYRHMGGIVTHVDGGHENRQEGTCVIEYHFTKGE